MATGINRLLDWLASFLGLSVAPESITGYVLAALVHIFLLLNLVAVGALVFIWLERKVSGRIQDRLGPTRVGGKFGWLQTLADGIKLLTKEDLMPDGADEFLFKLAPYVSFCASLTAFMAIPFAGGAYPFVAMHLNVAVFFIIAVLGLGSVRRDPGRLRVGVEVVAVRRDARSGPSRQLRSAARHVRRRAGAHRPDRWTWCSSATGRPGGFWNWYIFHDPFTFVTFWVYFTCATASVNRAPVRPGRSGKRAGGRVPHRILRPAVELFLHGRVRLDVGRQPAGIDPVPRRLERADSDRQHAWV